MINAKGESKSNYELFNRSNDDLHLWSWNYRGCWHQTCPPLDTRR
uniref:LTD domain-containing protein n=1 Tax=Heterorhabditis bacteriophora TaxID=37862 RepID=A0A1I7WDD6_HETBA